MSFTLPEGSYHFRADLGGEQYWSGESNHCTIPGCTAASVSVPGENLVVVTTITYTYDRLYRLTAADYDNGRYYHYEYDAVGNRLAQHTYLGDTSYVYDIANRLDSVGGVDYAWDNNGNLLSDGENTYSYDAANRLSSVVGAQPAQSGDEGSSSSYAYNGLGDRMRQTVDGETTTYTLDMAIRLTQVLADGENTYFYGLGRISQQSLTPDTQEYFLGDALGSMRQLVDGDGDVALVRSYTPYGETLSSVGSTASTYGYTGEITDSTGMVYLRARYYAPAQGRFLTRDPWAGDYNQSMSYNPWLYAYGNPIMVTDPFGLHPGFHSQYCDPLRGYDRLICEKIVRGISLNVTASLNDFKLYDLCSFYGDSCHPKCQALLDRLSDPLDDLSIIDLPNSRIYGYWFHHMLNILPGWWNKNGGDHVRFRTVVSAALGKELHT